MNRYINLIVLCLLILFVAYSSGEPPVKDPCDIGESFLAALKVRNFEKLADCFQPNVHARVLSSSKFFETPGSHEVVGAFRKFFGDAETFIIEESDVEKLSGSKIHISYRFRVSSDTYYEQQIYAVVKEGLIESYILLCSGSFKPEIKQ